MLTRFITFNEMRFILTFGLGWGSNEEYNYSREFAWLRSASSLNKGLSIKNVTLFWANFDPHPPVRLCPTSRDITKKYVTRLGPPILVGLVQKARTKGPCTNSLQLFARVLSGFFCLLSGRFCPGWFLSAPPSVRIHLLQQKVKHHFQFHYVHVWYNFL